MLEHLPEEKGSSAGAPSHECWSTDGHIGSSAGAPSLQCRGTDVRYRRYGECWSTSGRATVECWSTFRSVLVAPRWLTTSPGGLHHARSGGLGKPGGHHQVRGDLQDKSGGLGTPGGQQGVRWTRTPGGHQQDGGRPPLVQVAASCP